MIKSLTFNNGLEILKQWEFAGFRLTIAKDHYRRRWRGWIRCPAGTDLSFYESEIYRHLPSYYWMDHVEKLDGGESLLVFDMSADAKELEPPRYLVEAMEMVAAAILTAPSYAERFRHLKQQLEEVGKEFKGACLEACKTVRERQQESVLVGG